MSASKWIILLVGVGVALWWFTRDPVEVAYRACLARVSAELDKSLTASSDNAMEKAVSDAAKQMGTAMGNAGCEAMREACKRDVDGVLCKAAMAQF